MLPRKVTVFNVLPFLAIVFSVIQAEEFSIALERQLLIHREPPVDNIGRKRFENITEHFITQKLDNFDHQNNQTFQMRYLKDEQNFKPGGPVFIFIGGEWEIGPNYISYGQYIWDLAKQFGGLLIYTEHRYYGKTMPTKTVSTENLKYLTIDQSLADLAHFVEEITSDKQLNATGGVIVVGRSYSATMAAWFRQKYPHLVNGAWASSAPLFAKLNYVEYFETVGKSIQTIGGEQCHKQVEKSFQLIENLIENDDFKTLQKLFLICDNGFSTKNKFDVWNFYSSLTNIFAHIVQYHRSGDIESLCRILTKQPTNETDGIESHELYPFVQIYQKHFKPSENASCISFDYASDIKKLKKDNTTVAFNFRPWFYQTCSEFGWYQTTDSKDHPFGKLAPIEFHINLCKDVFGDVFENEKVLESNVHHTNVLYGGFNPAVTNVYFTHGSLDPWHPMGILEDLNAHSHAHVTSGISHCGDMRSINYNEDSTELIETKITVRTLVKNWLKFQ